MFVAASVAFVMSQSQFFHIDEVADDVYAVVRNEPPGLAVDCNVLLIINEHDVVMVDANIGPESATATLDALAKITDKPVSAIIATHYHDDHMGGVATIRKRFPNVELIAHKSANQAITDLLKPAREGMIAVAPQMTGWLKGLIAAGTSAEGTPITDEQRASYESDIRIADRYAIEMKDISLPFPTKSVDSKLILKRGKRTIEILHLGEGHTPADLVVWLPNERVVASGDLVVWPVPLVGDNQSNVPAWSKTLAEVEKLGFKTLIPGHGPVMHDAKYLHRLQSFYAEVTKTVDDQMKAKVSLDSMIKTLKFEDQKRAFCGESTVRPFLFENYARVPSIGSAFRLN